MWQQPDLWHQLARQIEKLNLPVAIRGWDGRTHTCHPQPRVTLRLQSPMALRYLIRPSLSGLAEAYVEGALDVEGTSDDILGLVEALSRESRPKGGRWRPRRRTPREDQAAVRHHYDLSNDFYRLWLDERMVYSCAYFQTETDSLDQAQAQKLDLICRKLNLQAGERFLDIGCGWGGLVIWAASRYGVTATGITLSQAQYDEAKQRVKAAGLDHRCDIRLVDYRELDGPFDKVASVGMVEHVGVKHISAYMAHMRRLLADGGWLLNHGIAPFRVARDAVALEGGRYIQKHIFPLAELPALDQLTRECAVHGLELVDVESLRPHYALTLRHWANRLQERRDAAVHLVGDKTYRTWWAYLAGCSYAFRQGWVSVYQLLAGKGTLGFPGGHWTRQFIDPSGSEMEG